MAAKVPRDVDEYEALLGETIDAWPQDKRVALAACLAERWLPVYEAFSTAEDWGDAAGLRRVLDAVWAQAAGRKLLPADLDRYRSQLHDSTPHMDDFEAPSALATCMVLSYALDCCRGEKNVAAAVGAALSCFEAAVPDWVFEPEDQPRLWKQAAVRRELKAQMKLVETIVALPHLDDASLQALRRQMTSKLFLGVPAPAVDKGEPVGLTNQAAFEQYRRQLESHLRSPVGEDQSGNPYLFATLLFSRWSLRYILRLRTVTGKDGRLADTVAQEALVARNRAQDAREKQSPEWKADIRQAIELCLQNPLGEVDAKSLEDSHAYGPSLRGLWGAAKREGRTDEEAWESIMAWSRHKPAAWAAEDQRKKKGHLYDPEVGSRITQSVHWIATEDPFFPWSAEVYGERWAVRLNDFPDDVMYTLMIGDREVGSFHDWPGTWRRE